MQENKNQAVEQKESALLTDYQKIVNAFTSSLTDDAEMYAKSAVESAQVHNLEIPLSLTDREKAIFKMGVNTGLQRAMTMLQMTKDRFKNQIPNTQMRLL